MKKLNFIDLLLKKYHTPEVAVAALEAQMEYDPVEGRLNLQVALNVFGREEESFQYSKQLLELAPEDPRVLFNHGWHLLKRGELEKGLAYLEYGRRLNTYGNPPIASRAPIWFPQAGREQRVHLVLEGGLGDQIIQARFGKNLTEDYGCKVSLVCDPSLGEVFAQLDWPAAILQREAALGVLHQSWLPGMSAALALGLQYKDLSGRPYLKANSVKTKEWNSLLGTKKKLRVGIRWSGNPDFEHQQMRCFPPEILLNLRALPEVQLYSFQRDNDLIDLPPEVIDLGPQLRGWNDTAAALNQMDLMISSCTSVAHMSAALGIPTWVIAPVLPYFVWAMPGERSPWYDSITLFRQHTYGEWNDVGHRLMNALRAHYENSR